MKPRLLAFACAAPLVAGLASHVAGCSGPRDRPSIESTGPHAPARAPAPAHAPAPAPAPALAPRRESAADFLGVILAGQTVDLAPRLDGRVERVFVKPGDRVARGAPVAQMDARALRADLELARATLGNARRRLARRLPLAGGAISPEEIGEARAHVVERRTRVQQLREAIADASIPAPFDAVVAQRYVDPGGMAGPSRPVVRLLSGGDVRVRFAIPEQRIGDIAPGARVQVKVKGLDVQLTGTVESVAPEVDAAARMVFAVASLDVPRPIDARIASGMVARVSPSVPLADLGRAPPP